jgi:WD40 repeat protein
MNALNGVGTASLTFATSTTFRIAPTSSIIPVWRDLLISPDGNTIVCVSSRQLLSVDATRGKVQGRNESPPAQASFLGGIYSGDGAAILCSDKSLQRWLPQNNVMTCIEHDMPLVPMASLVHSGGRYISLSSGKGDEVSVCDILKRKEVVRLKASIRNPQACFIPHTESLIVSGVVDRKLQNGRIAVESTLACLSAKDSTVKWQRNNSDGYIQCLSISYISDCVATGDSSGFINWYRLSSGKYLGRTRSSGKSITSVVFSPDGRHLFVAGGRISHSGDCDGAVEIWNVNKSAMIESFAFRNDMPRVLAIAQHGRSLVVGTSGGVIIGLGLISK